MISGGMGLFFIIAALVWVVALMDLVRGPFDDPTGRLLLAALLLLVPPVGIFVWLVIRRHERREWRARQQPGPSIATKVWRGVRLRGRRTSAPQP